LDEIIDALIAYYQAEKLKQPPRREPGEDQPPAALAG